MSMDQQLAALVSNISEVYNTPAWNNVIVWLSGLSHRPSNIQVIRCFTSLCVKQPFWMVFLIDYRFWGDGGGWVTFDTLQARAQLLQEQALQYEIDGTDNEDQDSNDGSWTGEDDNDDASLDSDAY